MHKRWFAEMPANAIQWTQNGWATDELSYESMLARYVYERNPDDNQQQTRAGNARQGKDNPQYDQNAAEQVFGY